MGILIYKEESSSPSRSVKCNKVMTIIRTDADMICWYQIIQLESQRIAEVPSVTSTRASNPAYVLLFNNL
jgi:hypothetical protein